MKKEIVKLHKVGERPIAAVIENYDGLPQEVADEMKRRYYIPGNVLCAKLVEFSGDSYKVAVDIEVLGEGKIFWVNANNVKLYKAYDDDYMVYNPLEERAMQKKEKGEEE